MRCPLSLSGSSSSGGASIQVRSRAGRAAMAYMPRSHTHTLRSAPLPLPLPRRRVRSTRGGHDARRSPGQDGLRPSRPRRRLAHLAKIGSPLLTVLEHCGDGRGRGPAPRRAWTPAGLGRRRGRDAPGLATGIPVAFGRGTPRTAGGAGAGHRWAVLRRGGVAGGMDAARKLSRAWMPEALPTWCHSEAAVLRCRATGAPVLRGFPVGSCRRHPASGHGPPGSTLRGPAWSRPSSLLPAVRTAGRRGSPTWRRGPPI